MIHVYFIIANKNSIGYSHDVIKTKIMGVLNITPDSFFSGSRFFDPQEAVKKGASLFDEGADWVDVGGESSRPHAEPVSLTEELERVMPVIKGLRQKGLISIDTVKPKVALKAVEEGASLINNIDGFQDPEMIRIARERKLLICVMHKLGDPQTMQNAPRYPNGVVDEITLWFKNRVTSLLREGIEPQQIIIDPGIGFGKTVADNLQILHNLPKFKELGFPVLIGLSRKSFMSKILNKKPEELLTATIGMNTWAVLSGADMIRVHDVKEHREILDLFKFGGV